MCRTPIVVVVLAAIAPLGGCAASGNLFNKDECKVYGGTRLDATLISEGLAPDSDMARVQGIDRAVLLGEGCCGLVDLPFSMIADTVALPVTIPIALRRLSAESQTAEETPKTDKRIDPDEALEE